MFYFFSPKTCNIESVMIKSKRKNVYKGRYN